MEAKYLSYLSHDLRVVRFVSDRVAVMYLGQIMELSPSETQARYSSDTSSTTSDLIGGR